jgi:hypothetical protein
MGFLNIETVHKEKLLSLGTLNGDSSVYFKVHNTHQREIKHAYTSICMFHITFNKCSREYEMLKLHNQFYAFQAL